MGLNERVRSRKSTDGREKSGGRRMGVVKAKGCVEHCGKKHSFWVWMQLGQADQSVFTENSSAAAWSYIVDQSVFAETF
jgi:hypothetical protein